MTKLRRTIAGSGSYMLTRLALTSPVSTSSISGRSGAFR